MLAPEHPTMLYPWPHGRQNTIVTPDDHSVTLLSRIDRPHAVTVGHVFSREECDQLIALAQPKLQRATVVSSNPDEHGVIDHRRTSYLAHLHCTVDPLIARLEDRLEFLTGIPKSHGECFQIMRYGVGAEYQPHMDTFNAADPAQQRHIGASGQRAATMVIYLNDPDEGGETIFPKVNLHVQPGLGRAVYFAYLDPFNQIDPLSFHGGSPVLQGEKWIATKWFREKPYVG